MSVASRLFSMMPVMEAKFQRLLSDIGAIRAELSDVRGRHDELDAAVEPLKAEIGSVGEALRDVRDSTQNDLRRLDERMGMLTQQLALEIERMAAGYDANTVRVAQHEAEVSALRQELHRMVDVVGPRASDGDPAPESPTGASGNAAGDARVDALLQQWEALADPADASSGLAGLRALYGQLAKQYILTVDERDSLRQRANELSGTLQRTRREAGDRIALASVNAHLNAPFPADILESRGIPPITIVDIGAQMLSSEDHVYARLAAAGRCQVIGFEPLKDAADKRTDAEPGVRMLNHFIGKGGPASFQVASFDPASSLLEANLPYLRQFYALADMCRPVERQTVETTRLDDIPEITDCDYLKIDVQGGELDVLLGAERLLEKVLYVHSEVEFEPVYRNQPLFPDIDRHLRERGFELLDLTKLGHSGYAALPGQQSRSKLLWADAIYVKTTDRLAARGATALLKAAYIAHTNYGMHDFAAHLVARCAEMEGTDLLRRYLAAVGG